MENPLYMERSPGIKFAKLISDLADYFPHEKLPKLKYLLKGMSFSFRSVLIYHWFNRNILKDRKMLYLLNKNGFNNRNSEHLKICYWTCFPPLQGQASLRT